MNDALILGLICFVAGLVGAALGTVLIGRSASQRAEAQWPARLQEAIRQADARSSALGANLSATLTEAVIEALSARAVKAKGDSADHALQAHTQEVAQLRKSLERWQAQALAAAAPALDLAPVVRQITTALEAKFDASFEAQNLVQAAAQQKAELSLHQALQRVPQVLQQAIQVELEFQATQQAQRDQAQAQQQERWQAEQTELAQRAAQRDQQRDAQHEAQHAVELRVLLQALSVQPGQATGRAALAAPTPPRPDPRPSVPAPGSAPAPPAPVSARPPELLLTPIVRPEPVYVPEEPERELSDAELDALPPELPAAGLPRKRLLPAPTKPPPLNNI